jgi:protein tyrosine phosphatase
MDCIRPEAPEGNSATQRTHAEEETQRLDGRWSVIWDNSVSSELAIMANSMSNIFHQQCRMLQVREDEDNDAVTDAVLPTYNPPPGESTPVRHGAGEKNKETHLT